MTQTTGWCSNGFFLPARAPARNLSSQLHLTSVASARVDVVEAANASAQAAVETLDKRLFDLVAQLEHVEQKNETTGM
jgi:hypothetical protein